MDEKTNQPVDRTIGMEFEHVSNLSPARLADQLARRQLPVDVEATGQTRISTYTGWQCKVDGSINRQGEYPYGLELVSPPYKFKKMAQELPKALAIAREHGGINSSTGLHLHVGVPELRSIISSNSASAEKARQHIKQLWLNVEKVMFSYMPPSRRHNDYCRPGVDFHERYMALNMTPLRDDRGTIEFRMHAGTLNANKALAWALLCSRFVDMLANMKAELGVIDPAFTEDVKPRQVKTRSNAFYIHRVNKKWMIEHPGDKTYEFESLKQAYDELRKPLELPEKCSALRAFHYPHHGNAMTELCKNLGVTGPMRAYLEARYERMTSKFGVVGELNSRDSLAQDEANYYDEEELDQDAELRRLANAGQTVYQSQSVTW